MDRTMVLFCIQHNVFHKVFTKQKVEGECSTYLTITDAVAHRGQLPVKCMSE